MAGFFDLSKYVMVNLSKEASGNLISYGHFEIKIFRIK